MPGRTMTRSLFFVEFLDNPPAKLAELQEAEDKTVSQIELLTDAVRQIRESAKDLVEDITPRQLRLAREQAAAFLKKQAEAEEAKSTAATK